MADWQPIETAPKDVDILVWFDHDADPYQDPERPNHITTYAVWCEGGKFMASQGVCVARWFPQFWESENEYGDGYWLPSAWFARGNDEYEVAVNPTHWMPLPAPPVGEAS